MKSVLCAISGNIPGKINSENIRAGSFQHIDSIKGQSVPDLDHNRKLWGWGEILVKIHRRHKITGSSTVSYLATGGAMVPKR